MTIPVDDAQWHQVPEDEMPLPKNHYAQYCRSDGKLVVRITGPNAHVTGDAETMEAAVRYALKWFSEVGEEL